MQESGNVGTNLLVNIGITNDSLLCCPASRLELRLDQCKQARRKPRERKGARQNQLEGDEAHIDADEIRELGPLVIFQLTNVRLLDRDDLRTLPKLGVQLVAADIDGIDAARAASEEDVAESARRCTNVETDAIARIELEVLERCCQLDAAARHPVMLRLGGE